MVLLQKLHIHFHVCLFVLICKLLWHPPCLNFVIPEVLMDDVIICRFTADGQLHGYISDRNLSFLSNQSINSFSIVFHSWSGQIAWVVFISYAFSATLESFHLLVHLPLCNTVFSILYEHFLWIVEVFTPSGHKTQVMECCSAVV
jgi:hypothetical protein